MKINLTKLLLCAGAFTGVNAQTIITGPSSSQSSYLQPLVANSTITSIFTATQSIGGYTMSGIPDGVGAFDNGNGTFTMLMNHEIPTPNGVVRAHGSNGAFISKWVINKSTLAVVSGSDLMQNINLWNSSTSTYSTYNATTPSTLAAFSRFCSADLPAVSAFYNSATGKGTQERIFMNGEETGPEGRALAHIVTGPAAGTSYELPFLGKASLENYVACPNASDKTIVVGMDDATPGQVYVYIGTKTNTGTDIVKAGLSGGNLYGVAVLGLLNEGSGFPAPNTTFNLISLGNVSALTGSVLNTNSNNVGITNFLRPEDGAWDPSNPRDFYFVTTNAFSNPSRMWRLRFTDINNPELGGTITAVLDGTEGQKMMDNIGIDNYGHIMVQEDVGNNPHNGKIWQYKIATDALTLFAQHDTTRFLSTGANFLTQDEEASGIIDVQEILGPGMFLFVDQAHYSIPGAVYEGGQILTLYNPTSALANPEINVQGNSVSIPSGNTTILTSDNTSFGSANIGSSLVKTFVIQNSGPGVLSVSSLSIGGMNAGDFNLLSSPFPSTIAVNGTLTVYIQFSPGTLGNRNGMIYIKNNDFNEALYSYAIQGVGVTPEINLEGNSITIVDGNTAVSSTNNTDFGSVIYNTSVTKTFNIQNTGTGTLTISGMSINGNNSSMFTFINPVNFPLTLAANASQQFTVQYLPTIPATNTAVIIVNSNDSDESSYDFKIEGKSMMDVGINKFEKSASFITVFPNPAKDEATIKLSLDNNEKVTINICDVQGKKVIAAIVKNLEKGERELSVNTANLQNGEYFIQVNSGAKTTTIKMVVAH